MVSVLPVNVAGPETRLKTTGFPEAPPVAVRVIGLTPKVTEPGGVNVMDCAIRFSNTAVPLRLMVAVPAFKALELRVEVPVIRPAGVALAGEKSADASHTVP